MSPENDQCRWIGIRPTNPPEDIPVTLDGEVAHVIVDSGGGGLQPGAPLMVTFYLLGCVTATWYTVLNIAGIGHVEKIHLGIGTTFTWLQCRVTVDGGVPVIYTCDAQTVLMWKDLANGSAFYKELPVFLIRYTTSLKVEIMQNSGGNRACTALVTYLPDP